MISAELGESEHMQQDTSDTIRALMSALKESSQTRVLTEHVSHKTATQRYCSSCQKTYKVNGSEDIDIGFLPTESNHHDAYTSLAQCLKKKYTSEEQYDAPIYCTSCNQKTTQKKVCEKIQNTPNMLAFELNRKSLRQKNGMWGTKKLTHDISIPKELSMKQFSDDHNAALYDLKALIVHQGKTAHNGHYYTYSKINGTWHCINDERVKKVKNMNRLLKKTKHTATPCMLFYEKKQIGIDDDTLASTRSMRKDFHNIDKPSKYGKQLIREFAID
jgi:ubiquitin C-terminal hydrolase